MLRLVSGTSVGARLATVWLCCWLAACGGSSAVSSQNCTCGSATVFAVSQSGQGGAWKYASLPGNNLKSVAHGNGRYVAVGDKGMVVTSADGNSWIAQNSVEISDLTCVIYGNGLFVALGSAILTSSDGITWTRRSPVGVRALTYANGQFIGVGGRLVVTSGDGINWSGQYLNLHAFKSLSSIAYGNGQYVAVGMFGSLATSADGITWVEPDPARQDDMYEVVYGNGLFVTAGVGPAKTSIDGNSWTAVPGTSLFTRISFANGLFMAMGGTMSTSTDGIAWTMHPAADAADGLASVTYADNHFVGVGNLGVISTSANGVNWTQTADTKSQYAYPFFGGSYTLKSYLFKGIASGNGRYVVVGESGKTVTIVPSGNGQDSWIRSEIGDLALGSAYNLNAVAYGAGVFLAVGQNGQIATSNDGGSWTQRPGFTSNELWNVTYGNGKFVAVGENGTILNSATGVAQIPATGMNLYGVAYGNGQFVAVGNVGTIVTSADGDTWTARTSGTGWQLRSVAYGNGRFVAVGDAGVTLTSTDGSTWIIQGSPGGTIWSVSFGDGRFAAVAGGGQVLTSTDGVAWISQQTSTNNSLYAVAAGNGVIAAVGSASTIVYTTN